MGIVSNLLFGDNSKKTEYKDALYNKHYRDITENTFDRAFEGNKDYLDKNYEGGYNRYKSDLLFGLQDEYKNSVDNYNKTKNDVFGNGLIGSLLNPIAQTAGAVGDLTGMALSGGKVNAWDGSKNPIGTHRDWLSDLGALGETALTIAPAAKGLSVAKAGKAVNAAKAAGTAIEPGTKLAKQAALLSKSQLPKTIGQKMAGGALMGAGYGASGSLRDMGAENFDPGQLIRSTGVSAGVGGGLAGLGGLWKKYTSGVDKDAISKAMSEYSKKNAPYQEALEKLKSEGITGDGDALNKAYHNWAKTNHPDAVGRSQAVALLPANAGQGSSEPAQLLSSEKVSQQALENISGKAKANNPYIKANSFKTPVASYMKDVNDEIARNATEKFKTIQDAMNIVKAGRPAEFDISAIPRKKAANLVEALSNLKNNLITTNPDGKLSRYGTKVSNLLKTKKGKIGVGLGGGLLLSQLMRGNSSNSGGLSDEGQAELYNYIYGGQ